jgi:hypothetical protein
MGGWTKGPWQKGSKFVVGPISDADDQSSGMVIGVCDVYGDNAEADSHLIAAAPDLVEAAEEILSYAVMNDFLAGQSHENLAFGISKKDLLRLRAALAKARGEPEQKQAPEQP